MSNAQQNFYNQNTRPVKLREMHENTIKSIKEMQELERHMFQNLQSINRSAPDASDQEARIRARIQELVTIRQNLFGKLKGMYTSTQTHVTKNREDLADQIAVGKTMEEELKNTEDQLEILRAEKMNRMKMVEIGDYEYERYNELKGIMKTVVYGIFIILIFSFLMRQPWMPRIVAVALIAITAAVTIISVVSRLRDNLNRDDRDYRKFQQAHGGDFNKIVIPETKEEKDGKGLSGVFSCPTNANTKDGFTVMGGIQPAGSNNNYSFLN
tara:strand:- start:742 stop:1548 length:807 start_codon:yes stop_codon:yes gene_type:complete